MLLLICGNNLKFLLIQSKVNSIHQSLTKVLKINIPSTPQQNENRKFDFKIGGAPHETDSGRK